MKVLTMWQPYASLCVIINPATGEPYKTIETRSWKLPASLIGQRIALHAAKRVVFGEIGEFRCETWFSDVHHVDERCYCDEGEVGPPCTRGATRTPCLTRVGADPILLPLGDIVATCTLANVVPIVEDCSGGGQHLVVTPQHLDLHARWMQCSIDNERPYGLFEPGRYASVLADIVPVDPPVPFRGGQGLTKTWEPVAVS